MDVCRCLQSELTSQPIARINFQKIQRDLKKTFLTIIALVGFSSKFIGGSKVDEVAPSGVHIYQNIFVFNVPMANAIVVTRSYRLHNLQKQPGLILYSLARKAD